MNEAKKHDPLLPVSPQYIQTVYPEDEINLVDLWIALIQYKKIFFGVFILFLILGLVSTVLVFNERYMLNSAVEIGSVGTNGSIQKLESPESMISKLSNVLVPKITAQYLTQHPKLDSFKTTISTAKGSEIVLIQNKVKENQIPLFTSYQNLLAEELIRDHDKKIAFYQSDLKSELSQATDKLKQLKSPEELNSKLEKVILQQKSNESKLSHTIKSYKLIEQGGTDMILTTLNDDQRKLFISEGKINQSLVNIRYQDVLLSNRIRQNELTALIERSKVNIKDIKREHQIEIDKQQRLVESIQAKLDTYNRTRVVTQPVPSLEPQGLTFKILIILVVFLSIFAGFVAMLVTMFNDKVKQRLEEIS
jgi:hypothetical protein